MVYVCVQHPGEDGTWESPNSYFPDYLPQGTLQDGGLGRTTPERHPGLPRLTGPIHVGCQERDQPRPWHPTASHPPEAARPR